MENTQFKFLPRYFAQDAKKKNIIAFIESLDTSKKDDKIAIFEDYFLFGNLYESCNEIMRNKDILANRDIKARVHTVVASTKTSNDLAYVAENIDGVLESLRNQVSTYGTEGDFVKLQEAAKVWEKMNSDTVALVEKLKALIDTNLKKGFGSRQQLKSLEYKTFNDQIAEVEKLLVAGSTPAEVAEKLNVKAGFVEKFSAELIEKTLNQNTANIRTKLSANINRQEIADELKVSRTRLNKFITQKKLAPIAKKKEAPVKQAKKEKNNKETKAEPKTTVEAKVKTETKTANAAETKAKTVRPAEATRATKPADKEKITA